MLKIKSTFGNIAPDSHKPQKCCTMAKFPWWKSDISLLRLFSVFSLFLSLFLPLLSVPLHFSFIRFPLLLNTGKKQLNEFHTPSHPPFSSQLLQKNVLVFLNTEQIYWSIPSKLSLCTL